MAPTRALAEPIQARAALQELRAKTAVKALVLLAVPLVHRIEASVDPCAWRKRFFQGLALSENHMRAKVPTLT